MKLKIEKLRRELADKLASETSLATGQEWNLRDYNGNTVGQAKVKR